MQACTLPLAVCRLDGGTQSRVALDPEALDDYADALRRGDKLPPIDVFVDAEDECAALLAADALSPCWVGDGFHRFHAHAMAGLATIQAWVRPGGLRAAILHSCRANADHGRPRRPEDKERAVLKLLGDPEWGRWSNHEIARRCLVSEHFVRIVRAGLGNGGGERTRLYTHPQTGRVTTMRIDAIGKTGAHADRPVIAALEAVRRAHGGALAGLSADEAFRIARGFPAADAGRIAAWWIRFANLLQSRGGAVR